MLFFPSVAAVNAKEADTSLSMLLDRMGTLEDSSAELVVSLA